MKPVRALIVLSICFTFLAASPALATQQHWIKVVNILLERQMWMGQGQQLYSYTMHDPTRKAGPWSATWTYNKTSGALMLSVTQAVKVEKSERGQGETSYKLATVHLIDYKGDCTAQMAVAGNFVLSEGGDVRTLLAVPPMKISTGMKMIWNFWYAKLLQEHQMEVKKIQPKQ